MVVAVVIIIFLKYYYCQLVSEQGQCAYNWTFGVRLQATVCRLEDWAATADLEMDYLRISEKLIAVADLLAMSKHILMRVS